MSKDNEVNKDTKVSDFGGITPPWSDTSWSNPSSYDYRPSRSLSQNPLASLFTAATALAGIVYGVNYTVAMIEAQGDAYNGMPAQAQISFTIALLAGALHIKNIFARANSHRGLGGGNAFASLLGIGGGLATGQALYNMFPAVIPQ